MATLTANIASKNLVDIPELGSVQYRSLSDYSVRIQGQKRLGEGEIEGHASVFGVVDSFGTILDKGAFKRTIRERFPNNKIKFLFNHNFNQVIGRLTKLREDDKGLNFRGLFSTIDSAQDVLTLVREEALTDLSIGFRVRKVKIDEEKNEIHFTEVELFDVSVVTLGANPEAEIDSFRNMFPDASPQDIESVRDLVCRLSTAEKVIADLQQVQPGTTTVSTAGDNPATIRTFDDIGNDTEVGGTTTNPEIISIPSITIVPEGDMRKTIGPPVRSGDEWGFLEFVPYTEEINNPQEEDVDYEELWEKLDTRFGEFADEMRSLVSNAEKDDEDVGTQEGSEEEVGDDGDGDDDKETRNQEGSEEEGDQEEDDQEGRQEGDEEAGSEEIGNASDDEAEHRAQTRKRRLRLAKSA